MGATEICDKNVVLARYIPSEKVWKDGLNFFSPESEFLQVGSWGYDNGKQLLAHTHNEVAREINWTQEVLFIHSGRIRALIYNLEGQLVTALEVAAGDIIILLRGGHGYEILEDNTQVLEIKNGPYVGADADRRRL
jgi:uncharacterized protein YjlB